MIHPYALATATVRTVFVIGPNRKVKFALTYPANVGCNDVEILRVIDGLQLSEGYAASTRSTRPTATRSSSRPPSPTTSAKKRLPKGLLALKPYLRLTPQPNK